MISNQLKKLRKELRLTQQEFADKLGIKRNTVATYETGKSNPSDSAVSLICREFNVNEDWLRTGNGEMFCAAPTDELDALAAKYNLTHRDYVFIEYLLKDANARKAMENFCINYAVAALADDIPENTPAIPNSSKLELKPDVSELEEEYKKSRSDSASKTTLSASSTIDENVKEKKA